MRSIVTSLHAPCQILTLSVLHLNAANATTYQKAPPKGEDTKLQKRHDFHNWVYHIINLLWLVFVHKFINESCKKQHRVSPNTNIFSSPDMSLNKRHHQLRKLQHRPVWKMCFKSSNTVDGSEIRRSPVEVGSLFPSIYKVLAPSQVVQEFFTNNIGAFHFLSWSYVGPRLFTPEIVKVNRVPLRKQNEYMRVVLNSFIWKTPSSPKKITFAELSRTPCFSSAVHVGQDF